jgi:H+/Cl- antiporter ClcA
MDAHIQMGIYKVMSKRPIVARSCIYCTQPKVYSVLNEQSETDFCLSCGKTQKAQNLQAAKSDKAESKKTLPIVPLALLIFMGSLFFYTFAPLIAGVGGLLCALLLVEKLERNNSKLFMPAFITSAFLAIGFGFVIYFALTAIPRLLGLK